MRARQGAPVQAMSHSHAQIRPLPLFLEGEQPVEAVQVCQVARSSHLEIHITALGKKKRLTSHLEEEGEEGEAGLPLPTKMRWTCSDISYTTSSSMKAIFLQKPPAHWRQ